MRDLFFDLGWKDVDAAHNHHVVGASGNSFHASHRARGARQQSGEIARAIADHRHCLLAEGGENELTQRAIGQDLAAYRIDDLGIKVVFPDMQTILAFDALVGNARAHHLRQAVDIHGMHIAGLFDFLAHAVGPGLGPEDADLERGRARFDTLPPKFIENGQHIGRRNRDDVGLEVDNELDLTLRHAPGDRHHGEPSRSAP